MGVLQTILDNKRSELASLSERTLPNHYRPRPIELSRAETGRLSLIAEIKFRSPSAGPLSHELGVPERARAYEAAGADMISVLCDSHFFGGSYEHLAEARESCSLPLLCKEFVLEERQLDLARAFGADAVLLIVRCLEPAQLALLMHAAVARELLPLVEVHTPAEAALALQLGAKCIGVNARDLDTLVMDSSLARETLASLPADVTRLHLSGLRTSDDVAQLRMSRADAALVGEVLMRQDDPRPLLTQLARAARGEDP
jgi:indole-3-glycerol phosphate synthase